MRSIKYLTIFLLMCITVLSAENSSRLIFIKIDKDIENEYLETQLKSALKEELSKKNITVEEIETLEEIMTENNMTLKELDEKGILREAGINDIYAVKIKRFISNIDKKSGSLSNEIELAIKSLLNPKQKEKRVVSVLSGQIENKKEIVLSNISKTAELVKLEIAGEEIKVIESKPVETTPKEIVVQKNAEKEEVKPQETQKVKKSDIKKDVVMGKFMPDKVTFLKSIPDKYLKYRRKMYINEKSYESLTEMLEQAEKDGIKIQIFGAWRSFEQQRYIWNNLWREESIKILKAKTTLIEEELAAIISAKTDMPGMSSFHWGTDIEVEQPDNDYFDSEKGKAVYEWLSKNGINYGFVQNDKNAKWRWTHIHSANDYAQAYIADVSYNDIKGFYGAETSENIEIIDAKIKRLTN